MVLPPHRVHLVIGCSAPVIKTFIVTPETTVLGAILQSGILQEYPDLHLANHVIGIYGQRCRLEDIVQADDRIEIYMPLECDVKAQRRQRVLSSIRSKRSSSK